MSYWYVERAGGGRKITQLDILIFVSFLSFLAVLSPRVLNGESSRKVMR